MTPDDTQTTETPVGASEPESPVSKFFNTVPDTLYDPPPLLPDGPLTWKIVGYRSDAVTTSSDAVIFETTSPSAFLVAVEACRTACASGELSAPPSHGRRRPWRLWTQQHPDGVEVGSTKAACAAIGCTQAGLYTAYARKTPGLPPPSWVKVPAGLPGVRVKDAYVIDGADYVKWVSTSCGA